MVHTEFHWDFIGEYPPVNEQNHGKRTVSSMIRSVLLFYRLCSIYYSTGGMINTWGIYGEGKMMLLTCSRSCKLCFVWTMTMTIRCLYATTFTKTALTYTSPFLDSHSE